MNLKDLGAEFKVVGGGSATATAAGTGDNTAATGAIIDMQAQPMLSSGLIVVFGNATLAEAKTLAVNAVKIEHGAASNLSDAAEYTFGGASTNHAAVATGGTGGSTEAVAVAQRVDLTGCKRYVRVSITPDLSATGTDTCTLGFGLVVGGATAPLTS